MSSHVGLARRSTAGQEERVSPAIRFVLVRPRRSGNVGAIARVLACFPVAELVLVRPRTRIGTIAARRAVRGVGVLDRRREVASFAEAVADCVRIVGTIGRTHGGREPVAAVRASAASIVAAAGSGPVAVVFGPEDHGLSRAEIGLCHELATIPTGRDEESLNLSHAAAIFAYEILLAAGDPSASSALAGTPARGHRRQRLDAGAEPPTAAEREALVHHVGEALSAIGYLKAQRPARSLAEIRKLLDRVAPTRREVRLVRGIARRTLGALARGLSATRPPTRS